MELFKGLKKPLFISEISSNHNNDLSRCKELIDATKEAGCDGVKFQLFKIDKLFSSEALIHKPEIALRKKWELNDWSIAMHGYNHLYYKETNKKDFFNYLPEYLNYEQKELIYRLLKL